MAERIIDYDGTFIGGAVSSTDVSTIPIGSYDWSMNMVHRGGVLMVRPGYKCLVTLPEGRLQGSTIFRPKAGLEQVIVVIDGNAWIADFPFTGEFRLMPGVLMSPDAPQVFFQICEQSVERLEPAQEISATQFITPKNILIIQDGGRTAPAFYDGFNSGHSRDNEWGIPGGSAMAWVGDRLWVAQGTFVFASDIANPMSFREQFYLGGFLAFVMPAEVTGLAVTPSLDLQQLLIFTEHTTTLLQANIRDRASWQNTQGFQTEVYKIGCVSHRSITPHYGQLWWMSSQGIVNIDMATQSKITSRVTVKDVEMAYSAIRLSPDLGGVAGAAFGNYVLMSVPFEDVWNEHTWALDNSAAESLNPNTRATWSGFWTGTRPVQWMYGVIAGAERIYYTSKDHDGQNRLWEAFQEDRRDNGCPITWAFATRGYFGPTAGLNFPNGRLKKFCYADLAFAELKGDIDVAAFIAGGSRGQFRKVMTKQIKSAEGTLRHDQAINYSTSIFNLKPQTRVLRTEDIREIESNVNSTCPVERDFLEDRDETFQLVIVGSGRGGVRWIRTHAQPEQEDLSGRCEENEQGFNAVRFDGAGAKDNNFEVVKNSLSAGVDFYESTQIVQVSQKGYESTGVGSGKSVISQSNADRIATVVATRAAEKDLRFTIPPILSDGKVD
jgi:hypothetical protein